MYARSLVCRDSLRGAWAMFAGIGARPLGVALFADPLIQRGALHAHRLDARDTRYRRVQVAVQGVAPELWARRSCFVRHERPLIVCEVFLPAIQKRAAAIILAHNHPSGDPTPSDADIRITRDLVRAGQLLKIEVLDHVIFGARTNERPRDYVSLRELGYF